MKKILYVEDNLDLLACTKEILIAYNFQVFSTTNIEGAIKLLSIHEFDLLLLDFDLGRNRTSKEIVDYLEKENRIIKTIIYSGESKDVIKKQINYKGLEHILFKAQVDIITMVKTCILD